MVSNCGARTFTIAADYGVYSIRSHQMLSAMFVQILLPKIKIS